MDRLGRYALLLSLALAAWGLLAAVVGLRRQRPLAVESARTTAYALLAAVTAANGAMLVGLLSDDFALRYVAQNSSRATPAFFKVLALWSADDGSLLLWNLVLAGYLAAVAFRFRRYRPETLPGALAVMYGWRSSTCSWSRARPSRSPRWRRHRPMAAGPRRCCRTTR